jgi:translation elongation factor EF-G
MKKATRFRPEEIRNVVLLGHGGAGKTTLAEAMLHRCGAISRMGSVTDGDTTADFEPEAKAHRHSTSSSLLFATYAGREVNFIDTPGHPELVGYALEAGTLAGCPVHDVRVVVTDGKHHPVDSKDSAFRTAGKFAVRDANAKARPVLLEPVVNLEVSVPEQFMGTITGDLKHVRGRAMGVESLPGGYAMVRTQAPLAELGGYAGHLCGGTGGTGSFVMELSHDEPVSPQAQQNIVEARQARKAGAE